MISLCLTDMADGCRQEAVFKCLLMIKNVVAHTIVPMNVYFPIYDKFFVFGQHFAPQLSVTLTCPIIFIESAPKDSSSVAMWPKERSRRPIQYSKASLPMDVTLAGMDTVVREEQFWKVR